MNLENGPKLSGPFKWHSNGDYLFAGVGGSVLPIFTNTSALSVESMPWATYTPNPQLGRAIVDVAVDGSDRLFVATKEAAGVRYVTSFSQVNGAFGPTGSLAAQESVGAERTWSNVLGQHIPVALAVDDSRLYVANEPPELYVYELGRRLGWHVPSRDAAYPISFISGIELYEPQP